MKRKSIIISIVITAILILAISALYIFNMIPHKKYENKDFDIKSYVSKIDKDNDGIDDQTDMLKSVREYIATEPKYKSKYYATGYPDDGYGVCTDVVAFGMKGAGYDLKELVFNDVKANQDKYNINTIDKNIDFRRVRNLKVYFDNNAISLTTDVKDYKQWQGGDIVVFKTHIGVVSDKRNGNGVPFVIHHYGKRQKYYEEDILEVRNDIVGHYRIS